LGYHWPSDQTRTRNIISCRDKRERIEEKKIINTIGCPDTLMFIAFVVFVAFIVFLALKYPIAIVDISQSSAQMAADCHLSAGGFIPDYFLSVKYRSILAHICIVGFLSTFWRTAPEGTAQAGSNTASHEGLHGELRGNSQSSSHLCHRPLHGVRAAGIYNSG
jgi:hypothetical protein